MLNSGCTAHRTYFSDEIFIIPNNDLKGAWVNTCTLKNYHIAQLPKIWAKMEAYKNQTYWSNGILFKPNEHKCAHLNRVLMFDFEDCIYEEEKKLNRIKAKQLF